jgi:NAD(P)H dehydrogenase (quinone)
MTKPKVLIAFYSRNGSVEALALAAAAGAEEAGAEVRLRRARESVGPDIMARAPGWADNAARMNSAYEAPSEADAEWADAVLFGSPTRFGLMTAELKAYIDSLGALWFQGKLFGKAAGGFTSTSGIHGGNETTIVSMYNVLSHFGMVIVPLGGGHPALQRAGTPYGASSVSFGPKAASPTEDDLAVARFQGGHVTRVAAALRTLRVDS